MLLRGLQERDVPNGTSQWSLNAIGSSPKDAANASPKREGVPCVAGGERLLSCVDGLGVVGKALKSQHFPRRQKWIPSLDHMNPMEIDGCRTTAFNRSVESSPC